MTSPVVGGGCEDVRVQPTTDLVRALRDDIDRSGYYPELVADVVEVALAGEEVTAYLLQPETTFDDVEVRRHLTALVLTPQRLVVAHVDDHPPEAGGPPTATASTEAVPLEQIRTVVVTHGVSDPAKHSRGARRTDLTIAVGWGAVQRIDLEPATCGDPNCEADHGYTGATAPGRPRRARQRGGGG
ncbi:conserved hypothetical protein [Beutenbergia cavernae DSM 12333]|uniref:Phosphodiesterase n=1 Tax=Beutenbergia cavernae (strain ATCC BAA-8 / DSM 12333 / CCUG 43141 / JCM 11478 / NBRC 16432 / NCIMB 13614 / HKI 0122) TaxID=471853 RepID=C5C5J5_BEUC1|nr:conserved hypothetical protein [Beutenbergia cavernae DSM 12333]